MITAGNRAIESIVIALVIARCWVAKCNEMQFDWVLSDDRAHRVCLACNSGAVGDEMHLVFECAALASLRSRYASLFTGSTDTMRSFFAQPDHVGVFHYVVDCLDFMMI